jgi:hypothetical protein
MSRLDVRGFSQFPHGPQQEAESPRESQADDVLQSQTHTAEHRRLFQRNSQLLTPNSPKIEPYWTTVPYPQHCSLPATCSVPGPNVSCVLPLDGLGTGLNYHPKPGDPLYLPHSGITPSAPLTQNPIDDRIRGARSHGQHMQLRKTVPAPSSGARDGREGERGRGVEDEGLKTSAD